MAEAQVRRPARRAAIRQPRGSDVPETHPPHTRSFQPRPPSAPGRIVAIETETASRRSGVQGMKGLAARTTFWTARSPVTGFKTTFSRRYRSSGNIGRVRGAAAPSSLFSRANCTAAADHHKADTCCPRLDRTDIGRSTSWYVSCRRQLPDGCSILAGSTSRL